MSDKIELNIKNCVLIIGEETTTLTRAMITDLIRVCVDQRHHPDLVLTPPYVVMGRMTYDTDNEQTTPYYTFGWIVPTVECGQQIIRELEEDVKKMGRGGGRFDFDMPVIPDEDCQVNHLEHADSSETPLFEIRAVIRHYYSGEVEDGYWDSLDDAYLTSLTEYAESERMH